MPAIKPRRNFRGRFKREDRHRINERVRAPEVRLIDEEGKLVGLMSSLSALNQARSKGLDLVEVHDKSNPPVCKIMDYGKWRFETKKREKQNKRNQTKVLIKEIQFRPRTDEGDIKIKLQKAKEFLNQGNKVKINLRFFGREMAHKELGFKLLKQMEERLSDLAYSEEPAKMEKRVLYTILAPHTAAKKSKASLKKENLKAQSDQSKPDIAEQSPSSQEKDPKTHPHESGMSKPSVERVSELKSD